MEKDINEAFKIYGQQTIDQLEFSLNNVSDKDIKTIQKILPPEINSKIVLNGLYEKIVLFFQSIRNYSTKAHTMNCFVRAGDLENHLILDIDFLWDKSYFNPINYNYLLRKNTFPIRRVWNFHSNFLKESTSRVSESNLNFGFNYNYAKSKKSVYISNSTILNNPRNVEVETQVKLSTAPLDIKRNHTTSVGKIIVTKNLDERSYFFRNINELENTHNVKLEVGHKNIYNRIDYYNCSPDIIAQVPEKDSVQYLKFSYEKFQFDHFKKSTYFTASSSVNRSVNSLFLKNKLFLRKFFDLDSLLVQLNVEFGLINSLLGRGVKIHEKFLLNNFKGITTPSKKVSVSENQTGDSLGVASYLQLNKKIYFTDVPFFNSFVYEEDKFQLLPFVHFNFLFTPEYLNEVDKFRPYYFSGGFGLNFFCEYLSFEIYYNAYLKKNSKDLSTDFSFNFGLD